MGKPHVPKDSASQQQTFLKILKAEKAPDAVGLKGFSQFSKAARTLWFLNQHEVTAEEREEVERETITQASCERWHDERVSCITASIAHLVLRCSNPREKFNIEICQRNRSIKKPWLLCLLSDTDNLYSVIHITDEVKENTTTWSSARLA